MKLSIFGTVMALLIIAQAAMAAESAETFKDHMAFGDRQFRGRIQDRDYEAAKTAALEALKIAETADEKCLATLLLGRSLAALGDKEAARAEYSSCQRM